MDKIDVLKLLDKLDTKICEYANDGISTNDDLVTGMTIARDIILSIARSE